VRSGCQPSRGPQHLAVSIALYNSCLEHSSVNQPAESAGSALGEVIAMYSRAAVMAMVAVSAASDRRAQVAST
jgi:hypothetical protein